MKRKLLWLTLIASAVILCLSFYNVHAASSGTCGTNLTYTLDDAGTLTISGTGEMTNWYSYSSVPWYSNRSSIKSVVIEDGVTSIGDRAFSGCSSLTSITIPDSVTSIGSHAFNSCNSLTAVHITDIDKWCEIEFANSYSNPLHDAQNLYLNGSLVTDVVISDDVTSIGGYAFDGCSSLTSITVPDSVTSIGDRAFSCCYSLTSITIPDSVTSIGDSAFYSCYRLTSITIGDSVTSIGNSAFSDCDSLTSITIPDSVTSIGYDAFYYCSSLTSINVSSENQYYSSDDRGVLFSKDKTVLIQYPCGNTATSYIIPNSVTSIGDSAFSHCSSLVSITIPDSVTSIGNGSFYSCDSLTSMAIPDSVTSIGNSAFYSCNGLMSINIPDGVTSIGYYAFFVCRNLTSITIPASVTSIGTDAFYNCTNLTIYGYTGTTAETYANDNSIPFVALEKIIASGTCGDNLTWTLYESGKLVISGTGEMTDWSSSSDVPWYSYQSLIKSVVIENGVTSIGNSAFYNCSSITSITISDSVTSIGNYAFNSCDSLTSIIVGDSITSIGYYAFWNCISLESITIPDGVTSIGSGAFNNCSNLTGIYVSAENQYYSSNDLGVLFNKDKTVLIQYPCGNAATSYIIPNSVTSIGDYAFYHCSLTSITIPDSVTSIGDYAFGWCRSLTNIIIPDGVTSIGDWTFYNCGSLTSITIGDSVTSISNYAFASCSNLESITIPDSVTSIGSYAFYGCSNLKSITIPASVTSIGTDAFYNCTNLTIYGYTGTTAETYANDNSIPFVALDAAHEHSYGEWVTEILPTCTEHGKRSKECSCGDIVTEYIAATGHAYVITTTVEPTCTEDGYIKFACTREGCGAEKTQALAATGHDYGDDNVCDKCGHSYTVHKHTFTETVKAPTCTEIGYTLKVCDCGYSLKTDIIEQLGHRFDDGTVTVEKTCTSDGLMTHKCTRCDASYTAIIPAGHDWEETVVTEPTCDTYGEMTRECRDCGAVETVVLPAAHKWDEGVVDVSPDCENSGSKTCTCTECGATQTYEIPALGHNFVNGVCTRCGAGFVDVVTPVEDHPVYGMYFEIDDIVSSYGPSLIDEYGVMLDYNDGAVFDKVGVYLTQDGTMWRRTIACTGENITHATYVPYLSYRSDIKYTGLNSEWINIFKLSEDADGIWKYSNYATIGVNLEDKDGNLLLSLYDIGQAGKETRIFDDLDEMKAWLGADTCAHSWGDGVVTVKPGCTTPGFRVYTCANCGKTKQQGIAALGHSYGEWIQTKEPTYFEEGEKYRECSVCGDKEISSIDKLPEPRIIASGVCGDNLFWTLDETGALKITGTGDMYDYDSFASTPWAEYSDFINSVTIEEGASSIGNNAFGEVAGLEKAIIPESVTDIGTGAFDGCDELTIYGYFLSYAEEYADVNDIPFVALANDTNYLITLRKIIAGLETPSDEMFGKLDLNGDGRLNTDDLVVLRKKIAGLI